MKRAYLKNTLIIAGAIMLGFSSCKKKDDPEPTSETITINDDGSGTGTVTWKTGNTYILEGMVFVNDGQVLTIEPGVIIKGKPGTGEDASALIVSRGAKIYAEGTASQPIIFTAEADNLNGNVDNLARGLWGGVIILGNATLNSTPGETAVEGIPTSEPRGIYGGTDDADNSGVFKYVSIRHGGSDIGEGNEINGLTLGAVGSGTTIEYVEVIANKDDGFEFFGGAVTAKHLISAFNGDDSFDYDEGFHGKGQYWLAVQDFTNDDAGDRMGEHDGGTDPENGTPYSTPKIYNVTYIGKGAGKGLKMITLRDNSGGTYANSIFLNQEKGIDIEMLATSDHSYARLQAGDLALKNNIFWNVAANDTANLIKIVTDAASANAADATALAAANTAIENYFVDNNNNVADPGLTAPDASNQFRVLPTSGGVAFSNVAAAPSGLESAGFRGAFGTVNWTEGWTLVNTYIID
ncbi:MAG: hypothetical protein A2W91_06905 [Bacteroidetes bacterium GWF2_38_335]|nr:MAG: hypothetical protein A2W91_06905 [Bacteroidetes bacterium GWF2_38_335]OFY80918.1 MAG: hypothetical protein A2281_04800 [Bacteroidetes bacterium RIFOXYA12_FULL_38_20]